MATQKTTNSTSKKTHDPKDLKYQMERDRQKVRGIFKFHECPGGLMKFPFKKYKHDPVEIYEMVDGRTYEVPLGVARHLNTSGSYPVYKHIKDSEGNTTLTIGEKVRRYSFQSLDFIDADDLAQEGYSDIVTASTGFIT